ncbi:hypothetical protein [Sporolactobacillus sp. KGMB 08714]|uniref:hypothetical protein n=1 Tax=Sporolactobacillus sp. KGMB 08714 TaxID=3064704 RepID=UPI002FBD7886
MSHETVTEEDVSKGFAEECFSLGFEMDGGNSFMEAFPDTGVFQDYRPLDQIIDQVQTF